MASTASVTLAECVDNPRYEGGPDQAVRDPSCKERVLEALREGKTKSAVPGG